MGSKMYPPGTNHFDPNSPLFKKEQGQLQTLFLKYEYSRMPTGNSIMMSNAGLAAMLSILAYMGPSIVARYYLVPYLVGVLLLQPLILSITHSHPQLVNHWWVPPLSCQLPGSLNHAR
jgi:hypothetical protein